MPVKTIKVFQVINEFNNPAHEWHLCIFSSKEKAKEFTRELKENTKGEFTIKQLYLFERIKYKASEPVKLKLNRQFNDYFMQCHYESLVADGKHWRIARKEVIRRFKEYDPKGEIKND